jgi:cytidine deaminase
MKHLQHLVDYIEYDSVNELSPFIQELYIHAKAAAENAHAPYSMFRVGAALLLDNGEIIIGNNQENAAYPSGTCAERVAVFYASAKHPNQTIKDIVVCTLDGPEDAGPISPCGACRQVLLEYQHRQKHPISLYLVSRSGMVQHFSGVNTLLPFAFNSGSLK